MTLQARYQLRLLLQLLQSSCSGSHCGWRHGGGKDERTGFTEQVRNERFTAADKASFAG